MSKWHYFCDNNYVIDLPEGTAAPSTFIFWHIIFRRMYFQNSQRPLQLSHHFTYAKLSKISNWRRFSDNNDVINFPGRMATISNFIFRPISFRWMIFQSFLRHSPVTFIGKTGCGQHLMFILSVETFFM